MPLPPEPFLVDTHEDIAWHCMEYGHDLTDSAGPEHMISLPWLQAAGVRLICGTLFALHDKPLEQRRHDLVRQYEMYHGWFSRYPDEFMQIRSRSDLAALAAMPPLQHGLLNREQQQPRYPLGVILLMEGLELLEHPGELEAWFGRGVRMASLTWYGSNHYASGDFGDGGGLKPLGHELLDEFSRLGLILDISHLNDAGLSDVFSVYGGPLCASHSNARTVCGHERNLTDAQMLELARRGGVAGILLLGSLLVNGWKKGDPQPPLSIVVEHIQHLTRLAGNRHVGLGSDLDGGLTPANTPQGIDRVSELPRIGQALRDSGMSEDDVSAVLGRNWWRFFELNLPE